MRNELLKFIKSLQLKKFRKAHSSFFVEGKVNVLEAIDSEFKISHLLLTPEALNSFNKMDLSGLEVHTVSEKELKNIGTYKTNSFGLAVLEMPVNLRSGLKKGEWSIALEDLNDPGNLGTIIRTADWFGIEKVFCSSDTVDFYSPKVINSTKGSFARVSVFYCNLNDLVKENNVVTAEMVGHNVYDYDWPDEGGIILMGNESHGVSNDLSSLASKKLTIPQYGGAESLNVAIATSIFCSELARKKHQK